MFQITHIEEKVQGLEKEKIQLESEVSSLNQVSVGMLPG